MVKPISTKHKGIGIMPICQLSADKNAYGFIALRSRMHLPTKPASSAYEACFKTFDTLINNIMPNLKSKETFQMREKRLSLQAT